MWTVYARSPSLTREGEIEFTRLEAIVRFNAVGSWVLDLDGRAPLVPSLILPQWGIEVVHDGITVLAGPIDKVTRKRDDRTNTLTLSGSDDNTHLAERLAHPQPATASPPYSANEHDVRTGTCSTVLRAYVDANAAGSALGPRRVSGLTVDTDPIVGSTITGRARWQNLLEFLQELALSGGGVGFRVRQVDTALKFQMYMPEDRSGDVQFSLDKGNLSGYSYSASRSAANYLYAGGGGEGTARTIREGQDSAEIAQWRRVEKFADRRDTTDTAELDQAIGKELEEGRGETSASATPVDLPGSQFLVDYELGDTVSAIVDGATVTDVIREVKIDLTPDGPQRVTPSIGTPAFRDIPTVMTSLRRLTTRVVNLERR